MLGTRTKQVFSYGRRGHRIVNVSERQDKLYDENSQLSRKIDPPVASLSKALVSPSPPPHRRIRKKKIVLSSPLSPPKHKTKRTRPVIDVYKRSPSSKPVSLRQPLSAYSPNVPKSTAGRKKTRLIEAKGTPLKQPYSPVVDVDIIIMDDSGRRISQERRVSRTDVQVNPATTLPKKPSLPRKPPLDNADVIVLSDSDDSSPAVIKPRKRIGGKRVKPIIISSDESGSEQPADRKEADFWSPPDVEGFAGPSAAKLLTKPVVISIASTESDALSSRKPLAKKLLARARAQAPNSEPLAPSKPPHNEQRYRVDSFAPAPTRSQPHQLTPIRNGRSIFPRPPSPPSPSTPTDLELSFDFSKLSLHPELAVSENVVPEYILPLLAECGQTTPHEFSAFIETFPMDLIVGGWSGTTSALRDVAFQKIGEASYSEVFGIGDVVLKIVPIRDEDAKLSLGELADVECPAPSDAKDVRKEVIVTKAMGELCNGFVKLLRTYVVRGKYPSLLLDLWDEYNDKKGSESIRPDMFTLSQLYAIIVLPNGGPDLEAYTFSNPTKTGWRQACSLFWQVTRILAQAEDLMAFEHRDLHWGQILVKNDPSSPPTRRNVAKSKLPMDHPTHGVMATIIDLGLARMDSSDNPGEHTVHWTPFDEEIFEGEGRTLCEYQFDVYRYMRNNNGNDWETYHPLTNVMWLHYLTMKLRNSKRLRTPPAPRKNVAASATSGAYTERECYECLVEMQVLLSKAIESAKKPPAAKKGRRKTQAPTKMPVYVGPKCAEDVLIVGVERGWVKA
ncbi:hypothetical protein EW146_g6606 [Bondarzewia mesenterica]|uniref:non-specific serine/threonine protein kinase n=1 Tax=Bondarzewia mesenterica TaxID=1095465 RepID=A0A4S4LTQ1_9AGAM|nr:hypothetical protein EW146_g6606 [Bondarzewia mesenterica]